MTYIDPTLKMSRLQVEEMLNKVRRDNIQRQQMNKDCKKTWKLFNRRG